MPRMGIERPFLREGVSPVLAIPQTLKRLNVLYHTEFLVVRLFHQEAVVLDARAVFGWFHLPLFDRFVATLCTTRSAALVLTATSILFTAADYNWGRCLCVRGLKQA